MKATWSVPAITRMIPAWAILWLIAVPTHAKYGGGDGTAADPYQIWTAEQMNAIGAEPNDWDKHFKLMADIDLSAYDGQEGRPAFDLIARGGNPPRTPFTGTFDGAGHTIARFTYRSAYASHVGLFRALGGPSGKIRNLGLTDLTVDIEGGSEVGGLVGCCDGHIVDCHVSGGVVRGYKVGGVAGVNRGTIERCRYSGTVMGPSYVGGLVGDNCANTAVVRDCHSAGSVTAEYGGGGAIGRNLGEVFACYSAATVSGGQGIGGLIGHNDAEGLVMCCYATGSVRGDSRAIGGLVGANDDTVVHSYSVGAVSGPAAYTGGLVGWIGYNNGRAMRTTGWSRRSI